MTYVCLGFVIQVDIELEDRPVEDIVKDVFKRFMQKWFSPKEEEWLAAFKSGKNYWDYTWGVLWVSHQNPQSSWFWAWKAWLMNMGIVFFLIMMFRK